MTLPYLLVMETDRLISVRNGKKHYPWTLTSQIVDDLHSRTVSGIYNTDSGRRPISQVLPRSATRYRVVGLEHVQYRRGSRSVQPSNREEKSLKLVHEAYIEHESVCEMYTLTGKR